MRLVAIVLLLALAPPALAQDAPGQTPEETAADVAAVEAANLSDSAYRNLWCGGLYSLEQAAGLAVSDPAAAQLAGDRRTAVYRRAAADLLATGMAGPAFTAIAEDVFAVVASQTRTGGTARDFTDEECAAAAAATP